MHQNKTKVFSMHVPIFSSNYWAELAEPAELAGRQSWSIPTFLFMGRFSKFFFPLKAVDKANYQRNFDRPACESVCVAVENVNSFLSYWLVYCHSISCHIAPYLNMSYHSIFVSPCYTANRLRRNKCSILFKLLDRVLPI